MSNEDYRSCIMTAVNEIQDNKALELICCLAERLEDDEKERRLYECKN